MARQRHQYVPRFDGSGGGYDDDDVGDLDFNILFTPGHDHHNHRHQHRRRPFTDDDWDPTGPNTEVGRRWRANIQEAFQREGREHGEWAELPTWYVQMHTKLWQDRRRERGEEVPDLRDPDPFGNGQRGNQTPGINERGRARQHDDHDDAASDDSDGMIFDFDLDDGNDGHVVPAIVQRDPPIEHDYIANLTAQVTRQQRYVTNIRDQLDLPAGGNGGRRGVGVALRQAEGALRTLQEALEEAQNQHDADPLEPREQAADGDAGDLQDRGGGPPRPNAQEQGDADSADDEDEGADGLRGRQRRRSRSRHRRPPGLDPAARRQTERSLERLREALQQMRWMGAAPREQHEVAAEIAYLQDVLAGRFARWGRGARQHSGTNSASSASPSSPSPSSDGRRRRRHRARRELGCYAPPSPLSAEDPRLPPRGAAREQPVELWDAEGPRFLMLLLLDNPAAAAAARRRELERVARERFARYREAQFFTVVERAMEGGALQGLSSGPRGVIWVVEAGREDVVGALLRAREEPFGIRSWEVLGAGVGAAEGVIFVLHDGGGEEESESGDGGSGSGSG
ncbi:uncharacterized protein LTHEOB_5532 [Neofusicoccum parvum]|nr:uncharacterized protein LTHEOB_5532 [Neofusicoccum parvum]